MVPVPKRLFTDGEVGRIESIVETMVSQHTGPSMPAAQLQSAPVKIPPEPSGSYGGGDKAHVQPLDHHLRGRPELPGADVGGGERWHSAELGGRCDGYV